MNRTDRMLAIVLELQAKKQQRAEDLAATFEVSKRTIYRDVLALMEAGVPVISAPGQGYSLVEGYFLPPLSFTTDEAIMLILGNDFVSRNFDAQYRAAAESASHKISVVLPAELRDEVDYLQRSIRFVSADGPSRPETLQHIRRAIIQRRTVSFDYHARFSGQSTREADPYALVHAGSTWYMIAHCHLNNDTRTFRLDRVEGLTILSKTFKRPSDFQIRTQRDEDRPVTIRALFDADTARWIKETPSFFQVSAEDRPDGLLITFQVRHEDELLQWLLGWGAHVHVLEPESLQEKLLSEAEAMMRKYAAVKVAF